MFLSRFINHAISLLQTRRKCLWSELLLILRMSKLMKESHVWYFWTHWVLWLDVSFYVSTFDVPNFSLFSIWNVRKAIATLHQRRLQGSISEWTSQRFPEFEKFPSLHCQRITVPEELLRLWSLLAQVLWDVPDGKTVQVRQNWVDISFFVGPTALSWTCSKQRS